MSPEAETWHQRQRTRLAEGAARLPALPLRTQMMLRNELHGLERLIAVIDPSTEERSSPVMGDLAGMVEQTVGEIAVIADALEWTAQQIRWADGECR